MPKIGRYIVAKLAILQDPEMDDAMHKARN